MAPLQVLTLNVWGLWLVSKKRYNRILHLAEFLANDTKQKHELDVVLLQEVWVDTDARILASAAREGGLPYSMHFKSGVFGSGLLTLSRFPIVESAFHVYMCAGDPMSLHCGDYLAAKGVGWVRLATPSGPLDVFNTHLHANYEHSTAAGQAAAAGAGAGGAAEGAVPEPPADEFAAFRVAQVLELARFVGSVGWRGGSLGVVLGGDLNCGPHTLEAELLRSLLPQLRDAWLEGPAGAGGDPGHTCKAAGNSFQPRRQRPSRIDYVLSSLKVAGCQLALQKTPDGHSFSDHFAVHARLTLPAPSTPAAAPPAAAAAAGGEGASRQRSLLGAARSVLAEGCRRAAQASSGHVTFAIIMFLQAVCICAFEPIMAFLGHTVNPRMRPLVAPVMALLAAGAGVFLLVGLVADCGQARALQQAYQQVEAALGLAGGKAEAAQAGGGGGGARGPGVAARRR